LRPSEWVIGRLGGWVGSADRRERLNARKYWAEKTPNKDIIGQSGNREERGAGEVFGRGLSQFFLSLFLSLDLQGEKSNNGGRRRTYEDGGGRRIKL
jgi:hypothetical protein